MKVLVCVSRVPDTATRIAIDASGKQINSQGVKYIVNPYDEFALEEAIRLKEKSGAEVIALTVGSADSSDILRTALAMGADSAILVKAADTADSFSIASDLAAVAKEINPELILMGRQSIDYDSYQMASMLAEMLDMPSISVVSSLTINGNTVSAERDIEGGKESVSTSLPCIISAQKGLNEPRYPKLPDIMKAKKKEIAERNSIAAANRVETLAMEIPSKARVGKILGDSDSDIAEIVRLLHEDAKVI